MVHTDVKAVSAASGPKIKYVRSMRARALMSDSIRTTGAVVSFSRLHRLFRTTTQMIAPNKDSPPTALLRRIDDAAWGGRGVLRAEEDRVR